MRFTLVQVDYTDPNVTIIAIELVDGNDTITLSTQPDTEKDLPEELERDTKALIQKIIELTKE